MKSKEMVLFALLVIWVSILAVLLADNIKITLEEHKPHYVYYLENGETGIAEFCFVNKKKNENQCVKSFSDNKGFKVQSWEYTIK